MALRRPGPARWAPPSTPHLMLRTPGPSAPAASFLQQLLSQHPPCGGCLEAGGEEGVQHEWTDTEGSVVVARSRGAAGWGGGLVGTEL